jgi:hypothetical protein
MLFDFIPLPFVAVAAVFFSIVLIETILSLRWVPFYMRSGIPVWRQSKPILKEQFEKASARMDGAEMSDKWYFTIVFKQIGPYELAFQNKSGEVTVGFRRRMTIRGIVKLDKSQNIVKIVTFFPWFILVLVALIFALVVFGPNYFQGLLEGNNLTFFVLSLLFIVGGIGWQIVSLRKINERILERLIEESRAK